MVERPLEIAVQSAVVAMLQRRFLLPGETLRRSQSEFVPNLIYTLGGMANCSIPVIWAGGYALAGATAR